MKHFVHIIGGNFANTHGMEYFAAKALQQEDALGSHTSYRRGVVANANLRARDLKADILLVIKGELLDPMTIYSSPRYAALWYQDDVFAASHAAGDVRHLAWAFDKVYSFDKCALQAYSALGARNVDWLPLAADPDIHKANDCMQKEYDISFVGHMFPNRKALCDRLKKRFKRCFFGVDYERYAEIVAKTKVNLNLGIGSTGIQQRVFEVLCMGGFLLTNSIPDNGRLFKDGEHLAYFDNENVEERIEHYLSHDKEREGIAENGWREVLGKHTYRHRVRKIMEDAEIWMSRGK